MKMIVAVFAVSLLAARADTWQSFAEAKAAAGVRDPRAILAAMVAPGAPITNVVTVTKPAARLAFEVGVINTATNLVGLVAPEIPANQRLTRAAGLTAVQIRAKVRAAVPTMTAAQRAELQLAVNEALLAWSVADGYGVAWPPAADFGRPTYDVWEITAGPSWWQVHGFGAAPPTVFEIDRHLAEVQP